MNKNSLIPISEAWLSLHVITQRQSVEICNEFYSDPSREKDCNGRRSYMLVSKVWRYWTDFKETRHLSVKNSYTGVHKNTTNGLVADTRSQIARHTERRARGWADGRGADVLQIKMLLLTLLFFLDLNLILRRSNVRSFFRVSARFSLPYKATS
jgi:hypothetical protein